MTLVCILAYLCIVQCIFNPFPRETVKSIVTVLQTNGFYPKKQQLCLAKKSISIQVDVD